MNNNINEMMNHLAEIKTVLLYLLKNSPNKNIHSHDQLPSEENKIMYVSDEKPRFTIESLSTDKTISSTSSHHNYKFKIVNVKDSKIPK